MRAGGDMRGHITMVRRRGFVALFLAVVMSAPVVAGAATPLCEADPAWGTPAPDRSAELFVLVNAHRGSLGLSPLLLSPSLGDSADWKSRHMASLEYFSHQDPAPIDRSWEERVGECGYPGRAAENIAFGSDSALVTLERWLASPVHRANIDNPAFTVAGVGVARSDTGVYYWVQNFGAEVDGGTTPAPLPTSSDAPDGEGAGPGEITPEGDTTNRDPDARGDSRRARRTRWVRVRVLGNDSDPDGDALSIARITARPSKGRVRINDAQTFLRYRARRGATGRDKLSYFLSDGRGGSATAVVRLRVVR